MRWQPKAKGRHGIPEKQMMPSRGFGVFKPSGSWLVEGPTWTHLWLGVEPQSGSVGTGGDILAISALSLRGTQWHPGGKGRNGGPLDAASLSSTPAPTHWVS